MKAMMNTEVAVNKHGIMITPNQPMYKRFSGAVLSFSMHSSLVKVTKFEKCNCLHIPSQGGKGLI
jgi:hypothetical protein